MLTALVSAWINGFLAFAEGLAMCLKKIHFRNCGLDLRGIPAVLLGGLVATLRVGCVVAGISGYAS